MSVKTKRLAWAIAFSISYPVIMINRVTSGDGGWFHVTATVLAALVYGAVLLVAWHRYLQARRRP